MIKPSIAKYTEKILGNTGTLNQSERVKWIEKTLKKIPKGLTILDAGAGELQFKKFCKHLKYTSQDFAQYDGQGDASGLQTATWDNTKLDIVSDITKIPRPDKSFDAIMCTEVFEHLPDPVAAIKEFSRLLKPGGYLLITAPFDSLTHFAPFHFCTGFNRYFYKDNLEKHGFEIKEITPNGSYFDFIAQEARRLPWAGQQYSQKHTTFFEKISLAIVIRMIGRFSRYDMGSSELACFGYHVFAKKKK